MGIVPQMRYLCEYSAITNKPLEYSLMVESKDTIILTVSRYDLLNRFPKNVFRKIREQMM